MELAIYRKTNNHHIITIMMVVICIVLMIPSIVVLASALTDPTIGMTGVNNSQLTVGMTGINHDDLLLDYNPADWHINPSDQPLLIVIPLVFLAFSILLIFYMLETKQHPLKILLTIGILIYIALALLPNINNIVNSLLGG